MTLVKEGLMEHFGITSDELGRRVEEMRRAWLMTPEERACKRIVRLLGGSCVEELNGCQCPRCRRECLKEMAAAMLRSEGLRPPAPSEIWD